MTRNTNRFEKILYTTFPSIKNSNLTEMGKIDMYNYYMREAVNYVEKSDDFQRLSEVYQKYVDIRVKMNYDDNNK